jgi:protein TonB
MEWPDEEFEEFLRRFQPLKPAALELPRWHERRGTRIAGAVAAAVVVAVGWLGWRDGPRDSAGNSPAAAPFADSARSSPGAGAGTGISPRLKVGEVDPPELLTRVNPIYPQEAQEAGIEGLVVLDIVVGEDGSVIDVSVFRSVPELDQAAIDAVSQWRYSPTFVNGEPVEVELSVTVNFTLQ